MRDKISLMPTKDKNELIASTEALKRELPAMVETIKVLAQLRKASFDAHIEAGLTPEQALELCKASMQI